MPTMDIVSEIDAHELVNSVDQANREISTRFDFKGSDARIEQQESQLTLIATSEFQVEQMLDVLHKKLVKRGIRLDSLEAKSVEISGKTAKQIILVREGIDQELAKKIIKLIKETKLKVQATIQSDQVRVSGKKKDDLQAVISLLKGTPLSQPVQFSNFRE